MRHGGKPDFLGRRPCLRSLQVISSLESRITSAMVQGCSRAAALRSIQQADVQRQRRMRYLFDVAWRDPALYDLVVNLEDVRLETAADVVVYMAQHPEYQPTPASPKALDDLTLSSRIEATLAVHGIEVEVRGDAGVVWVAGVVDSGEVVTQIRRLVQMVRGVKVVWRCRWPRGEALGSWPQPVA